MRGSARLASAASLLRPQSWPRERKCAVPPPCPPDWSTGPPGFVGVGAQKAGTSWWYALVTAHPRVHANPTGKELHFFDRFWDQAFGAREASEYQHWFSRPPGSMSGEWTPSYMFDVWAPGLLRVAAPEARLLVMLRDPLERYVSGLTHYLQRGAPRHPLVVGDAFRRGLYADQVLGLHQQFGPGQVLVLQYEACIRDPPGELARTYRFLELEPWQCTPDRLDRVVYGTTKRKETVDHLTRTALIDAYQADIRRLVDMVPELDLSLWPTFAP